MKEFITIIIVLAIVTAFSRWIKSIAKTGERVFLVAFFVSGALMIILSLGMFHIQSSGQYTYNQYYDGTETSVEMVQHICQDDGDCVHTYTRSETYSCSSGGTPTICTKNYYDPLFAEEDDWIIHSTLGDFTVATGRVPTHWEPGSAYIYHHEVDYSDVENAARDAGIGEPQEARDAQKALILGYPRAATMISPYSNPINGNNTKTATSDKIDYYQKLGVLPSINSTTYGLDQSNKVLFAGIRPPGSIYAQYQRDMGLLDEESGNLTPVTKRFDIEAVIVNSAKVPAQEARVYAQALDAYWQSDTFQKSSLPKNMCVIVLGTDGQHVTWAYGFTLIDTDNNVLWNMLALHVPGASINPDTLLGTPKAVIDNGNLSRVIPSHGVVESLVFGPFGFNRSHITNNHPGSVGYEWLNTGPPLWFCFIVLVVSLIVGGVATFIVYGVNS